MGITRYMDQGRDGISSHKGGVGKLQEITFGSNGTEKKRSRSRAKLLPIKGKTKIIERNALSSRLYRQGEIVRLYTIYFNRKLGTMNMTQDQERLADRVRKVFEEGVTEVFTPKLNGQGLWPFTISEIDLCKLAWAMYIDQGKILVPKWLSIEKT